MAKLTVRDLDAKGKEVLMRVDFNVPLKDGEITNDARIVAALPTIKFLLDQGARLVLTSHLGRPKNEPDPAFSLKPVAARLSELLGKDVKFVSAAIGPEAEAARAAMKDGDVVLLENVRFYPGEKKNDPEFAKSLLGNATLFVNDAFGTAHRAHASTEGVEKADTFLIGGAMANTFLAAEGYDLGASKIEGDKLDLAREILAAAKAKGVKFLLPADVRVAMKFEDGAETFCTAPFAEGGKVPEGGMAIDIGDKASEEFSAIIKDAKTVLWNGPMGVFEMDCFAKGTKEVAEALADSSAISIVGGGDSVTAAKKFKVQDKLSFCSTGGGASLELLEGKVLPGVGALTDKCCCGK